MELSPSLRAALPAHIFASPLTPDYLMTDLWWTSDGAGPTLLLVHGGLGLDHSYLRAGYLPLADRVRIVSFDQRGCGRSPDPTDWNTADYQDWVTDIDAVRHAAGATRPILVGHSFGGVLALEYALRWPDRVAGLILTGAYPVLDYIETAVGHAMAKATPAQQQALMAGLSAPFADDAALARFAEEAGALYFHRPTAALQDALRAIRWRGAAMNRTLHHWLPAIDLRARLSAIRCPVLIASGTDDWIAPTTVATDRLHAGLTHADRVDFSASGHFPFLEEPAAFQAAVTDWLARHGMVG